MSTYLMNTDGKATGGSDGCINFEDADNTGIPQCLVRFGVAEVYAARVHMRCAVVIGV